MSTTPDQTSAEQCEQHPTAPRIGGMCGGCTQYPTDREQPTAPHPGYAQAYRAAAAEVEALPIPAAAMAVGGMVAEAARLALTTGAHALRSMADEMQDARPDRLAVLDGRDALAFVVIRPAEEDPDRIAVEASARGMSKAVAAYALRQTAEEFDRAAIAEGDTPITPEEAAEEQQQRAGQQPADVVPAHVLAAFEQDATARQAHAAAVEAALDNAPRALTEAEHNRAWHAIEGAAGEPGADPGTILNAVLRVLNLAAPDEDVTLVPYRGEHGYPEGESPAEQRPAAEEPAADWVADVRAAIAFNLPEREPALETLRDVLLDTTPRTPAQALAAARLILAAHTRDQAAATRKHIADYSAEHGVNRSTRGLITGMGSIRRLLDQRADALDAEAQQP